MRSYLPHLLVVGLVCVVGCRQDMADQPRYNPLRGTTFFGDERSARPLEPNTVPRGQARLDNDFYEGQRSYRFWGMEFTQDLQEVPIPVTLELLGRGQDRFNAMCSMCHDRVGTGNGKVVQRGFLKPPSYHSARVRAMPPGYIFQVITRGKGGMPMLADQVTPRDRWAIVAYVKALQLSQDKDMLAKHPLSKEERAEWLAANGDKAKEEHP